MTNSAYPRPLHSNIKSKNSPYGTESRRTAAGMLSARDRFRVGSGLAACDERSSAAKSPVQKISAPRRFRLTLKLLRGESASGPVPLAQKPDAETRAGQQCWGSPSLAPPTVSFPRKRETCFKRRSPLSAGMTPGWAVRSPEPLPLRERLGEQHHDVEPTLSHSSCRQSGRAPGRGARTCEK